MRSERALPGCGQANSRDKVLRRPVGSQGLRDPRALLSGESRRSNETTAKAVVYLRTGNTLCAGLRRCGPLGRTDVDVPIREVT